MIQQYEYILKHDNKTTYLTYDQMIAFCVNIIEQNKQQFIAFYNSFNDANEICFDDCDYSSGDLIEYVNKYTSYILLTNF